MSGKAKKLIGGLLVAGALAAVTYGLFGNRRQGPFLKEYEGPDSASVLKQEIADLSKDRALFVMLHRDTCPYCARMTEWLEDARDETKLDYGVLKVEISRYPAIRKEMMEGRYVPENHIYYGAPSPDIYTGTPPTKQDLVNYMNSRHEWRLRNVLPAFRQPGYPPDPPSQLPGFRPR